MKHLLITCIFLLTTPMSIAEQADNHSIESVIKTFQQSIEQKDKQRFLNLFIDPDSVMVAVVSEQGMVRRRAAVQEINKRDNKNFVATKTWRSSPNKMINRIMATKEQTREEFTNVRVTSDGSIANVFFDYAYFKDNKKQNWGSENWQMVLTLQGWKISSVNYSITFI